MVLSVGIIGPGLVGSALLDQLFSMPHVPQSTSKFIFKVRGICDSKKMITSEEGIDLSKWRDVMKTATEKTDLDQFVASIQKGYPRHAIIVDCTSSEPVAIQYPKWLERRVHVVAPNKRAFSGALNVYHDIKKAMQLSGRHCLYETTVGAGLPIIQTIKEMRATGDHVTRIEGIFSGTLSFIFNAFSSANSKGETTKFSDIVQEAKKRGYTEPDPRDDLSGMDFARKILILARESGLDLQLSDMQVQNLVSEDALSPALSCPTEEFLRDHLPSMDERWAKAKDEAAAENKVLRYVGVIDITGGDTPKTNVASVGIRKYSLDHPFASLQGCDNVIAIYTSRYSGTPMIVQGPGAGAEVTAAGVFGDLFRVACYMT
jgi:aspartokinase/homoserine dehydrogenase 1